LLDFLREYDADTIYLVGDIVDGWALKSGWYWPQPHNDVVQKLLRKARKGARIIYVPGKHDEVLRDFYGTHFGGIEVTENAIHAGADGRRYLVTHGDQFDLVVQNARWLALLGDKAYDLAIGVNRVFNSARRRLGFPYWSLSRWAKLKVKNAVSYIGDFEGTRRGSRELCGGWRDLRPHPSRGDPRPVRRALSQLRRLGGKLHRDRRAPGWPLRDRELDRDAERRNHGALRDAARRLIFGPAAEMP
jgi:hypothetical protein